MSEKRKGQHKSGGLLLENQTEKRSERAHELRSSKREGLLAKRRRSTDTFDTGDQSDDGSEAVTAPTWTEAELKKTLGGLRGPVAGVLPHLEHLGTLLASEDPPIQQVVEVGAVPRLLSLLEHPDDRHKILAARCIANIASGDVHQTKHILDGTPALLGFLSSGNPLLQEEALWALGNIAGDEQDCRDMLIAQGAIPLILRLIYSPGSSSPLPTAATAAWALSNLARGTPTSSVPFRSAGSFPVLMQALRSGQVDLVKEAAWTIAFLTAKEDDCVVDLLNLDVAPTLVDVLRQSQGDTPICTPTLRALGNLASGPDEWVAVLLAQPAFLPCLMDLISSADAEHHALVKEVTWTISNIAGGHPSCRDAVVSAGFLRPVLALLRSGQFDVQREAAMVVWNMVADGKLLAQVANEEGVLEAFTSLLRVPDMATVRTSLSFLRLVCSSLPGGPLAVERAGGLEAIDELHYGAVGEDLSAQAAAIVDQFFGEDYQGDTGMEDAPEPAFTPAPQEGVGRGKHLCQPAWMKS